MMSQKVDLSIVIPLYRCEVYIKELANRIEKGVNNLNLTYEIIFVNDNSPMNDWQVVSDLCMENKRIKGINLSRNFGQHYAITAGLSYATGEWVVVMDGDLQDLPEEISTLYKKTQENFEIVLACRKKRKDKFLKRLGSKFFYAVLAYLTETKQNAEVANFGIYNRSVIDSILQMKDKVKYFPAMVRWVGFKRTEVIVKHGSRMEGEGSYTINQLINLAINTILSFSDKPLRLTVKLGIFISLIALFFVVFTFIRAITGNIEVLGYSSMIISIWLLAGVIITLMGMIGLYIGRIFEQVKNRPTFLISNKLNIEE